MSKDVLNLMKHSHLHTQKASGTPVKKCKRRSILRNIIVSICCSVTKSCPALCNPMDCSTPGTLSFTVSQSLLKLMSIELVMPSNRLILCHPRLLLPSIFPNIGVFSNESALHISWPKYWSFNFSISHSVNIQGWFPSGLTALILQSKGLSRVFSSTTIQNINSLALSLLYGPTLTSIHDHWKNHNFDYMDLCWQSNVSAF